MKINTWQLIGGLRAVFWGLPRSRTPQPQWVPWLEPRKDRVGLSLCCLGVSQPALWVFFTVIRRLLAGLVCSPSPLTGHDCLQPNPERKYLEKGLS